MNRMLVVLFTSLLLANSAFAVTTLGSGYACDGTKILDKKGKTVKLATLKTTLGDKISSLKAKIATAKKQNKPAKVTSLTASLNVVKTSLASAKKCSKGTLTPPISPLWSEIAGTYSGTYNIVLLPSTPFGDGTMQVTNTFDGTTATTTITFLTGVVQLFFAEPTVVQFTAASATFPIHQTVPGTPLGDLDVTLQENGEVQIVTTLPAGTFIGSQLTFLGNFGTNTFPGSFTLSYNGTAFAQGNFELTKP